MAEHSHSQTEKDLSKEELQQLMEKYDPESGGRNLTGWLKRITFLLAVSFSLFQIYAGIVGGLSSQLQRSIHLAFVLGLIFLLYPVSRKIKKGGKVPIWDICLSVIGIFIGLYWLFFLILSWGVPGTIPGSI